MNNKITTLEELNQFVNDNYDEYTAVYTPEWAQLVERSTGEVKVTIHDKRSGDFQIPFLKNSFKRFLAAVTRS